MASLGTFPDGSLQLSHGRWTVTTETQNQILTQLETLYVDTQDVSDSTRIISFSTDSTKPSWSSIKQRVFDRVTSGQFVLLIGTDWYGEVQSRSIALTRDPNRIAQATGPTATQVVLAPVGPADEVTLPPNPPPPVQPPLPPPIIVVPQPNQPPVQAPAPASSSSSFAVPWLIGLGLGGIALAVYFSNSSKRGR